MRNLILMVALWSIGLTTTRAATDLDQFETADALWAHIQTLQRGLQERPTSREQAMQVMNEFVAAVDAATAAFIARFPEDPRRFEARLMKTQLEIMTSSMTGATPDLTAAKATLKELLAVNELNDQLRLQVKAMLIEVYGDAADEEALAFYREVAQDQHPQLAALAQQRLDLVELNKKPIDLKFTSVSGEEIDLAKLRGKVILIDFWATWCRPCVVDMPNVIAAYQKYHDQGFEIIGISLDKEKAKLLDFVKAQGLAWPQYFDGEGWKNAISQRFGVTAIPAQWLIDKQGRIATTDARGDLDTEIAALLKQ